MAFARCLTGEPDHFFGSTSASSSSRTSHSPSQPSALAMLPTLLGWTRKSPKDGMGGSARESSSHAHAQKHRQSTRQSPPQHQQDASGKSKPASTSTTTIVNGVTHRRGEKSFLDFHQNYAITRHLGEGSYSTVKQVTHRRKGGAFACKIVDKSALSAVDRIALGHEVRVLASVRHDHVMRLHEVIEDDAKCYLIMELAEHGDLFDKIVKQGRFAMPEAQKVVAALVEALHYCHARSIIHRDVKPENVLLSADHSIKLCDFGFAKQLRDPLEKSTDSCGTPGYAAPEILDGKPYGVEVDVFSLGVVTYIMLCGYPPFPMKLSQLRSHRFNVRFPSKDWAAVDSSVKDLLTRMLHVKPELRPSMAALREHAWVQEGRALLDASRAEAVERRRQEALQRKQLVADTIRKKLITSGFDVVKHGRQGQPHRTKLRLSTDGRVLSWQPKLLKRGLLKYQNAKSFSSLFGFGTGSSSDNGANSSSGHGSRSASRNDAPVTHPQISRLSLFDGDAGGRRSEPILCEESERITIAHVLRANGVASGHHLHHCGSGNVHNGSVGNLSTSGSASSTGSASWIDRKNWWRSFRRPALQRAEQQRAERSASGGFSFAAFSLGGGGSTAAAASRSSSCSSAASACESYECTVECGSSCVSFSSSSVSGSEHAPPSPLAACGCTSPASPRSPSAAAERTLDSSINLKDIRSITRGEDGTFFRAHTGGNRGGDGRASSVSISGSECSASFETDGDEDVGSNNHHSHEQHPPQHHSGGRRTRKKSGSGSAGDSLQPVTALTVATRYRELHLEFDTEDVRDAFAFLLEQATLPLEDVAAQQLSYIYRSAVTPTNDSKSQVEDNNHITASASASNPAVDENEDGDTPESASDCHSKEPKRAMTITKTIKHATHTAHAHRVSSSSNNDNE